MTAEQQARRQLLLCLLGLLWSLGLVAASRSATGRSHRMLAKAAVAVAALLVVAAVVASVTIIIGIYVLPAAVALLVGANLALQSSRPPTVSP